MRSLRAEELVARARRRSGARRAIVFPLLAGMAALWGACPVAPPARTAPKARTSTLPAVKPGSAKLYKGPDGIRVALLGLVDGTYLVRVTGTTHPLDGKVIRCAFLTEGHSLHVYTTPYDGYELWLLKRMSSARQGVRYLVNLPGERGVHELRVEYDEAASTALRAAELVDAHEVQKADGTLGKLLAFDVQARMRMEEKRLARDVAHTNRKCHSKIRLTVDWDAVPEKTQKTLAIRTYCDELLAAMRQFCAEETVREAVQKYVGEVRCRVEAGDRVAVTLQGRTLHFTTGRRGVNRHMTVREALADGVRWPDGENIARKIYRAQTHFCTDGKGNYVGWRPVRPPDRWMGYTRHIYYGTAQKLIEVPRLRMGEEYFYDPRYLTKGSGWGPRGHYSFVRWDKGGSRCSVVCGARRVDLKKLTIAEAQKTLGGAVFGPPVPQREPHGLARDRTGTYYYVDKAAGEGAKDFRLFRGPLGRMVLQQMLNIVSDSEGEVYSTKTGSLRLVLERENSFWVERGKKRTLVNVPIPKNIALIYNELGVYMGQPMGTPCDIF